MPRGPMAKHPSARQRRNGSQTQREIVLRQPGEELRPVPAMPVRRMLVNGEHVETQWHPQAVIAWTELWQFPLVYQAPDVDRHLIEIYLGLIDSFWDKLERGKPVTEQANQIRQFSELWGIGEKSRRHLQITIQEAEEAMARGSAPLKVDAVDESPSANAYLPKWNVDDEDDGSIVDAEVVA